MSNTTYSFKDYNITITSAIGNFSLQGEGIGSMTTSMSTNKSSQSVGADGSVMTNFIAGDNGTVSFSVQQTSALNSWLTKLYNTLKAAPKGLWCTTSIDVSNLVQQEVEVIRGVSFEKLPDKPKQAEGQMITWNLMAQDIQQMALGAPIPSSI